MTYNEIKIRGSKNNPYGCGRHITIDSDDTFYRPISDRNQHKRKTSESPRVRLIQQIVGLQDEDFYNKFTPNYYEPKRGTHTPCLHDSNPKNMSASRWCSAFTYPANTKESLRWNPYVEVSSDEVDECKNKCTCEKCTMKKCQYKTPPPCTKTGTYSFKDNIVQFSDRDTMTPKLTDAGCGVRTPSSTPKMSSESVHASYTAFTDTATGPIPSYPGYPEYIPKKTDYSKQFRYQHDYPSDTYSEAVRDTDIDSSPYQSFKPRKSRCHIPSKDSFTMLTGMQRSVLYNEGISDLIANNIPLSPICRRHINMGSSKTDVNKPEVTGIPFAHRSKSKYHQLCKNRSDDKPIYFDCGVNDYRPAISRQRNGEAQCTRPQKQSRSPNIIFLPKKMLVSEQDIDLYVDKRPVKSKSRCGMNKKG